MPKDREWKALVQYEINSTCTGILVLHLDKRSAVQIIKMKKSKTVMARE